MILQRLSVQKQVIVLVSCWSILQCFLFYNFGIVTRFESGKYIAQANALLQTGHYTSGNFLFYSIEILLIAFSYITHTFPWLVVAIQLLVNAVSVFYFYKLCFDITKNYLQTFFVTLFFICFFYYQLYNVHLFTESLYFSFGIIYTYLLFSVKKISAKNIILLLVGISFLYFTRPTGVFFIPSTLVYLTLKFYRNKAWLILSIFFLLGVISLYFLLNFALNSGGEFDFLLPYLDERIICGVPTTQGQHSIYIPVEKNSVQGLFYIITHYPSLFFGLAGKRLLAFFGVVRSYFSFSHNIFIAIYFYSTYILGIFGLRKMISAFAPQTFYFLANICFLMITVMLSCDEWHNRFILGLFPFFLLLACGALITKERKNVQ